MHLVIETATQRGLIALCEQENVLAQKELVLGIGHSRNLEPMLQELFHEVKKHPRDLEFVACGRGPGSYTGVRVGVALAKALSLALKIPLVGVSSLCTFVPPADFQGKFLAVIDAKIGGVYCIQGHKDVQGIHFEAVEALVEFDAFLQQLEKVPFIVTPHYAPIEARIKGRIIPRVFETGPSADYMAQMTQALFKSKNYTLDGSCDVLYLRKTQAEMEKLPNKPSQM